MTTLGSILGETVNFLDPTGQFQTEREREESARAREQRLQLQSTQDLRPELLSQFRAGDAQQEAIQLARSAAQGEAPSAAELQLRRGLDRSVAQQFALASGANDPLAVRRAQANAARAAGGVTAQAAQLRAIEQERARQLLAQIAGQRRAQTLQSLLGIDTAQLQGRVSAEQGRQSDLQRQLDFLSGAGGALATIGTGGGAGA